MASKVQGAGGKKTNGKTPDKSKSPLTNQEKKEPKKADLTKKIKNLEDDNKRLRLENVTLKHNFDLREIIKELTKTGVTEVDGTELAKDAVKMALKEAEEKHSAEKKDMEKKHKKEIEQLSQNLQGEDQLPFNSKLVKLLAPVSHPGERMTNEKSCESLSETLHPTVSSQDVTDGKSEDYLKSLLEEKQQLIKALDEEKMKHANYITEMESRDSKHSQETNKEIAKFRAQNKELEREVGSLKAEKDELNKNIKILKTETETLKKKLEETEVLLRQKESELKHMEENVTHFQTRENDALVYTKEETVAMQNLELTITELNQLKEETKNLNDKLKKAEELLRQKESEITDMKKEVANLQQRSQETVSKPVNPDDIHILLRETTKEKNEAKSEKDALLAEKKNLEAEIQKLQNDNKEQKQSYEKSKELTEKEKGTLIAEKQKMDAAIKTLQDQNKALMQSEEKNKNLNEKLKKLEQEKDNLNKQVTALQKENDEVKYRLKESQSPSLSNVISANDNKAVQQLKDENERLRTRLSEVAGAQMTLNNPNIADLSDVFRPTKLSEEYSQLYDNLWTDAFEEHDGKKEEDIIQILRKALLGSYKFCETVCREFTVQLTNSSLALPNSKPKISDIPVVYKKQLQDMKKSFGVFLRNDVKESYRKQNTIEGGDKTKKYIDACVELCWLMVIQEPPVVIETPATKDSAFDCDTYKQYTKTGTKVDFVVWPALRLHQGGPLLTKGVAQGKN